MGRPSGTGAPVIPGFNFDLPPLKFIRCENSATNPGAVLGFYAEFWEVRGCCWGWAGSGPSTGISEMSLGGQTGSCSTPGWTLPDRLRWWTDPRARSGPSTRITGVSLGDQTGGYKIQVSTSRSVEGVDRPWDAQRLIGGGSGDVSRGPGWLARLASRASMFTTPVGDQAGGLGGLSAGNHRGLSREPGWEPRRAST